MACPEPLIINRCQLLTYKSAGIEVTIVLSILLSSTDTVNHVYNERCMRQFIVSYNNLFRILRSLPMRCSASAMFASSNVDTCQARIRRSIYSLRCRLDVSFNLITHSVIHSDVHVASKLNSVWIATLYNLAALR